jgi:hypothetical protein
LSANDLVRPVRDAIDGGAIKGQSITFWPVVDERIDDYQDGLPLIIRKEVRLDEGGPVSRPAYTKTTVGTRSLVVRLSPVQRSEIERFFSITPPGDAHGADHSPETPEPQEATTSRDATQVAPLDPFVADVLRRTLLEEFSHDRHGR